MTRAGHPVGLVLLELGQDHGHAVGGVVHLGVDPALDERLLALHLSQRDRLVEDQDRSTFRSGAAPAGCRGHRHQEPGGGVDLVAGRARPRSWPAFGLGRLRAVRSSAGLGQLVDQQLGVCRRSPWAVGEGLAASCSAFSALRKASSMPPALAAGHVGRRRSACGAAPLRPRHLALGRLASQGLGLTLRLLLGRLLQGELAWPPARPPWPGCHGAGPRAWPTPLMRTCWASARSGEQHALLAEDLVVLGLELGTATSPSDHLRRHRRAGLTSAVASSPLRRA